MLRSYLFRFAFAFLMAFANFVLAQDSKPPTDFAHDVLPILRKQCSKCHTNGSYKGGLSMDTRGKLLDSETVVPGNSADSPLIHYVARLVEDMEMPPEGKGDPLTTSEIALLRGWIDQGASWGGATATPNLAFTIEPAVRWFSVDGNEKKFRELTGMKEGWSGGLGHLTLAH